VINPQIATGTCTGGKIMLDDLADEADEQNFRALLFGDCTGNWQSAPSGALADRGRRAATVRVGRPAARKGVARVPVYVRSGVAFNSLELQLAYDATQLTPRDARLRRPSAGAIVTSYAPAPGVLRVAVASGAPLRHRHGTLLVLEFAVAEGASGGGVRLTTAGIDESPAAIAGAR
jgi:hypothetical protein